MSERIVTNHIEKPISLKPDKVRAIFAGATQIRVPIKNICKSVVFLMRSHDGNVFIPKHLSGKIAEEWLGQGIKSPFGPEGTRLWVRETWNKTDPDSDETMPGDVMGPFAPFSGWHGTENRSINWRAIYAASSPSTHHPKYGKSLWKPNIHMPRWASRLTLLNKRVWAHRIQDITEHEAIDEGVMTLPREWVLAHFPDYVKAVAEWEPVRAQEIADKKQMGLMRPPLGPMPSQKFAALWEDIYPGSWERNDFVFACSFSVTPDPNPHKTEGSER